MTGGKIEAAAPSPAAEAGQPAADERPSESAVHHRVAGAPLGPSRTDDAPAFERAADSAIFIATANSGKLREIEPLLARAGFRVALDPDYVSPPEGDRSYFENAALKARALHGRLCAAGRPAAVLADDSGLEVRALNGRPGVLTAEYGGAGATWSERRGLLLAELAATGRRDRRARFVCALHFIDAAGRELAAFGTIDGEIADRERGELGFSFDPIFLYPPAGRTFAELSEVQKNRVSHRAVAVAAIVAAIRAAGVGFDEDAPTGAPARPMYPAT